MRSREWEGDVHILCPHFWRVRFWVVSGTWISGEDEFGDVEREGVIGGYGGRGSLYCMLDARVREVGGVLGQG